MLKTFKLKKLSKLVLLALPVMGMAAATAEVSLYDYTEATSAYEDAYFTGNFQANDGNQGQASYNLDLEIDYEKVLSSPERNTKLDFKGTGSKNRAGTDGADSVTSYNALGSITSDKYFEADSKGLFWYGKGELGLRKSQEEPYTKITGGLGYGRVINVTPMARSMRIIEELRRLGNLTADPSKAVYNKVAQIIAKEGEYQSRYGSDYEQHWVAAIESVLKNSGTVKGGGELGALAIIKSYDVLVNERISTRKHGTLVRAGLGAVISNYDGESSGDPAFEIGMEYHKPLSDRTQFSNEAIITGIYGDNNDSYNLNNTMSLTHEVSDRIDWENSWTLDYANNDSAEDITTNTLTSTYRYYLSNKLDFSLTGKLSNTEDNIAYNAADTSTLNNDDWDQSLTMGITYRLK